MALRVALTSLATVAFVLAGVQLSAATFSMGSTNPGNTVVAHSDWTAPTVNGSTLVKSTEGMAGTIRQGGAYRVYANVSDGGNPSAGISTVRANLTAITTSQTAASLTAGAYTSGGQAYNYRSASLTAKNPLAAGSVSYTVTATDSATNASAATGFTAQVDNTAPTGTAVQASNGTGTVGKPELGDQVVFTFSEPLDPNSVLAAWSGATTDVVVRIANGASGDTLTVRTPSSSGVLELGTINLGRTDYVTGTINFGAPGTASQMTMSGSTITVVLGTASGTTTTAAGAGTMVWTPDATATDAGGNATSTANVTEGGAADIDF